MLVVLRVDGSQVAAASGSTAAKRAEKHFGAMVMISSVMDHDYEGVDD